MRRRDFITILGGAAGWPLAARAQQMPVIGFLDNGGPQPDPNTLAALRQGLGDVGLVEGRDVAVEVRASQKTDELEAYVADFARRKVAVIYSAGVTSAQIVKRKAPSIPLVITSGGDLVKLGFVDSLARPGGNVTGITFYSSVLVPKRLELLRELLSQNMTIGILTSAVGLTSPGVVEDVEQAARSIGQPIVILSAANDRGIETAFVTAAQQKLGAMLVQASNIFNRRYQQIAALAARYKIPTSYPTVDYVRAGGLMSYGDLRSESERQAGVYVGRILKGEKPADLPVLQPTTFQFAINLKTAKTLGITFPPSFHLRADEVIE